VERERVPLHHLGWDCPAISIADAGDLVKVVALIGLLPCVPIVYTYLTFLHYKGVAALARLTTSS
jgi:hypothetical protein